MHLLILHQATVFGGAERTTANLLSHLDRELVSKITLAAPHALRAHLPQAYDEFVDTAPSRMHGHFENLPDMRRDVATLADLLHGVRPDIALGMMHYSSALVVLGRRRAGLKIPTVGGFRGPYSEYIRRYEPEFHRRLFLRLAIGLTARLADRILVPSQGTREDTCRYFWGVRSRTLVIPNGIEAAAVEAQAQAPAEGLQHLPAELPLLCTAARLSAEKDLAVLIDAWRRVQETLPCALVVVGDGGERAALEHRAKQGGLADRLAFVGHRANVYPYMRRADVYVHTCQFEGFGYTMLEAMACGTPVIATDCPHGPREVLGGGEYGVLVPPGDPDALAVGIAGLLANANQQEVLRARGLQRARELSVQRMAARFACVFDQLTAGG